MSLHDLLIGCLAWIFYPLWLAAGGVDYLCHRRTALERTSGLTESALHVVQLVLLAIFLALATLVQPTAIAVALMAVAVILHSAVALVDVTYTTPRRYISPLEQWVHGYMDVLPLVALVLLIALNWRVIATGEFGFGLRRSILHGSHATLLLGSYVVLAATPVLEEFVRCQRVQRRRDKEPANEELRIDART